VATLKKEVKKRDKKFIIISVFVITAVLFISYFFVDFAATAVPQVPQGLLDEDITPNAQVLQINEVMSSNDGIVADKEGNVYDWVELYNGTDNDINLKNYRFSDVKYSKWVIGDQVIKAKSYLVLFLSGNDNNAYAANFKLKKEGGEILSLIEPNGTIADKIQMPALGKNEVVARNENNEWVRYNFATPGYENSVSGYKEFKNSLLHLSSEVSITEIMPKNEGHFTDAEGNYCDYIEITNNTDNEINLHNYSLSDDADVPFKWQFKNISLEPKKSIVVYATNINSIIDGQIHASFMLSSETGCVVLTNNKNQIIDKVEYANLPDSYAVMKTENGYIYSSTINPGYENTLSGTEEFSQTYYKNPNSLMINEVMNKNSSHLVQKDGEFYDWIELKNNSDTDIDLNGYYITTNMADKTMCAMPDVTLKAGQYYVLIASGDESLTDENYFHTNFKITEKESLYLCKDDKIVDSMFFADVPLGSSKGRDEQNGFLFINSPTPMANNNPGNYEITCKPNFTLASGIYNNVSVLQVQIMGAGDIYYTLDGSVPTTSSLKYKGPITLNKTTVLKSIAKQQGKPASGVNVSSYIINENHTLPVVSLSLNPSSFRSIQNNPWKEGYEVAAYAEYFELNGEGFEIPCGLKLFGGSTRGHAKKSFTINFRKKYGEGMLNYKVFDTREATSYNSLVLRTGSQDSERAVIRDVVMTSLVDKYTDVDVQAYKPVILYINGKYWGNYYLREFVDDTFVANHYNVDGSKTDILRIDGQIKHGSNTSYKEMMSFIRNNDLRVQKNYEYIKQKIDIQNLIDYWIAETYITNNDIVNCRFFSNPYVDGGKWKFIFYDLDFAMYNEEVNYYYFSTSASGMTQNHYTTELLRNLMRNAEFRQTYVERLSYNMKNTWKKENILAEIDKAYNEIKTEMPRNQARWGLSMAQWNQGINRLKNFVYAREAYLMRQTKAYFNLSNKEMEKYFGD